MVLVYVAAVALTLQQYQVHRMVSMRETQNATLAFV